MKTLIGRLLFAFMIAVAVVSCGPDIIRSRMTLRLKFRLLSLNLSLNPSLNPSPSRIRYLNITE